MTEDIYFKIRKNYNKMRNSERKVADYIINDESDKENITIEKLAEKSGVSQPTVIRFAKAIGYDGFKSLKLALIEESLIKNKSFQNVISYDIKEDFKIEDVPSKIISTNISHLENTIKSLSVDNLKKAVEKIVKADRIILLGTENSCTIAEDLSVKLVYMGFNVIYFQDSHRQVVASSNLKESDVAIGVSFSGNTKSTVDGMFAAKKRGAFTIAITNDENSKINYYADLCLYSGNEQCIYKDAIVSRCAQLAIVDMIYTGILLTDVKRFSEVVKKRSQIAESFLLKDI